MTAKDFLSKSADLKAQGSGGASFYKSQAMMSAALIGCAAGAYYGYSKKHNMLATSLLGALAGGLIARVFMPS